MLILVVTQHFADYKRGDEIKDAAAVKKILDSEQCRFVVKKNVSDEPTK